MKDLIEVVAFNAILGPGLIMEQLSFAIPTSLLVFQGRNFKIPPKPGGFHLGRAGWIPDLITIVWTLIELVFYDLPVELPVSAGNMSMSRFKFLMMVLFYG